jgi:hypothetical protein
VAFTGVPRVAAGQLNDGTYGYGTLALDLYETVPALAYPLSVATFAKMRHDPQIKSVLGAYMLPLRSATWAVNPRGCRDEVVSLVADAWGLPIAGDNDGPGPYRRRGVQWDDHLRLALLMLTFGHSPFAMRYDIGGTPTRARLAELSERLPQTITDIVVNDDGSLKGIHQNGSKDLISGDHLTWYVHEREGAAWQGQSMIRASYAPWLIKHELWRVLATSSRRFGMGIPQVTAPPGSPPADIARAADIAAGYRAGDQSGVGLPDGFRFDLSGLSGSVPDTLGFIRYLDGQIAASVMANVFNLDSSSNGSRALGETLIGMLELSWKATSKEIIGPANKLSMQMVDFNWGTDEPVPSIICSDISRPEITSEAIAALVTCGALTPELTLENDLRLRYQLPVIQERPIAVVPVGTPDPSPTPDAPVVPDPAQKDPVVAP